jgi:hypothetical protein
MKGLAAALVGIIFGYMFGKFIQWTGISIMFGLPILILGSALYATAVNRIVNKRLK